ncbi:MAG: substrate-binding domain-containing protein [Caldilineales bacterium]|nr:substrate-binding domain-containing protein [Caldilineales bacterium]
MATISDVAKKAGVSTVTVSRVINNASNVSPQTRARVEQAIDELGYVPSGVAQSLRSKRTHSLALIVPDIQNQFWTTVARGVEDAAQSRGYSIFLCNTDESAAKQQRYLEAVISQRVDGVAIAPYDSDAQNLGMLRQRNIPTVVIDRYLSGWDVDTVTGDSISGSRAVVKHLIDLGHRRIAMLSGPMNTSTAVDREIGYRIALAEANIPYDAGIVKYGEFRSISGERLTHQLLNSPERPSAIFAANNALAMGALDAFDALGLRVPYDIALVCFDDLPNTSRLFPFLTVVVQPAYDIGANAAQLLLSRLDSDVALRPRRVVLPTRVIIRHSCGSSLNDESRSVLSLPLRKEAEVKSQLVKHLTPAELRTASVNVPEYGAALVRRLPGISNEDKSDASRLQSVFTGGQPDRIPHFELQVTGQTLVEYVLGRKLSAASENGRGSGNPAISPAEHVEFAQRLGIDAVPCPFYWYPNNVYGVTSHGQHQYIDGTIKGWDDLERLESPAPLADQLNTLEMYLRAAEGTGVGVFASFASFFQSALRAVGLDDALFLLYDDQAFLLRLMDMMLSHQERVMRAVCDRFANDLTFILIRDELAHQTGPLVSPKFLEEHYLPRMERLLAPAKAYAKPLVIHTSGQLRNLLPILVRLGFDAVHPVSPESNDIAEIQKEWGDRIILTGGFPTSLLLYGTETVVEETVGRLYDTFGKNGRYIFSTSGALDEGVPPQPYEAMVKVSHRLATLGIGQPELHFSTASPATVIG